MKQKSSNDFSSESLSELLLEDSSYSTDQLNEKSSIIYCKDPKNIVSNVKKLVEDKNKSSLIVPSFISTDACLEKLISYGDDVALTLFYEEEHPGTDINELSSKILKEIEIDIVETAQSYENTGLNDVSNTYLSCIPILQEAAMKMLESYNCEIGTYLHNDDKDPFLFLLYIEVNMPGACIKLHSDTNGARTVVSLANGGTVISDSQYVNWEKWKATKGLLPVGNVNWSLKEQLQNTRKWNNSLCNPQYQLQIHIGDMLMMKGSMLTDSPCIHRAPYSAGTLDDNRRILMKLDYLPKSKVQAITESLGGEYN